MARPRLDEFTERKKVIFLTHLRRGQTIRAAAAKAHVGERTVFDHSSSDPQFAAAITRAKDEAEASLVEAITKSAHSGDTVTTPGGTVTIKPGDWRAAAWLLEHHPHTRERYAEITKMRLGGDSDAPPIQSQQETLVGITTPERVVAVIDILVKAGQLPALVEGSSVVAVTEDEQESTV